MWLHIPWEGEVKPPQPEKCFRLLLGSKWHIEAIINSVCLIFSNQGLFGPVFCGMWKLQVLANSEIMGKQAMLGPTEGKEPLGTVQGGFHAEQLH